MTDLFHTSFSYSPINTSYHDGRDTFTLQTNGRQTDRQHMVATPRLVLRASRGNKQILRMNSFMLT